MNTSGAGSDCVNPYAGALKGGRAAKFGRGGKPKSEGNSNSSSKESRKIKIEDTSDRDTKSEDELPVNEEPEAGSKKRKLKTSIQHSPANTTKVEAEALQSRARTGLWTKGDFKEHFGRDLYDAAMGLVSDDTDDYVQHLHYIKKMRRTETTDLPEIPSAQTATSYSIRLHEIARASRRAGHFDCGGGWQAYKNVVFKSPLELEQALGHIEATSREQIKDIMDVLAHLRPSSECSGGLRGRVLRAAKTRPAGAADKDFIFILRHHS
jgi:hypothetical protein